MLAQITDALLSFVVLVVFVGLGVGSIIAWCQIGKRLGYDLYTGLLMLIPIVNIFVFFSWAFRESPNERRIRALKNAKSRRSDHDP